MTFRCFVSSLVCLIAVSSGCGGKAPATPPTCDLACADAIALRSVRETMRFAYNFALQGKEAGTQDVTVPCVPTGHVHIVGQGSSNADLGTTWVQLTYTFSECKTFSKNTAPERNYTMTLNGVVDEVGTLAMGGATTSIFIDSPPLPPDGGASPTTDDGGASPTTDDGGASPATDDGGTSPTTDIPGLELTGQVYDPAIDYPPKDAGPDICPIRVKQDANNLAGTICGREVGLSGGF